jgi:hypothetical protein
MKSKKLLKTFKNSSKRLKIPVVPEKFLKLSNPADCHCGPYCISYTDNGQTGATQTDILTTSRTSYLSAQMQYLRYGVNYCSKVIKCGVLHPLISFPNLSQFFQDCYDVVNAELYWISD